MKIVHVADTHLGRRRLGGRLPDQDFADALAAIVTTAIAERADAFLIAGDLFDAPRIERLSLHQAVNCLRPLRDAGIPVMAIEGNHDQPSPHAHGPTWLHFLADEDLLCLLTTPFSVVGPILTRWNPRTRRGSWIDLAGVRFVGAGYLGATTPKCLRALAERLEPDRPTVLLLHAGLDPFPSRAGGLGRSDLDAIRPHVTYLALGHVHTPMIVDDWVCNPGSPENWRLAEARYDLQGRGRPRPRGYAVVQIDPRRPDAPTSIELRSNPRRPVICARLNCSPLVNGHPQWLEVVEEAAVMAIGPHRVTPESAVLLELVGEVDRSQIALAPTALEVRLEARLGAAAIEVSTDRFTRRAPRRIRMAARRARQDRDNAECVALLAALNDSSRGLRGGRTGQFVRLCLDLKARAQRGTPVDELVAWVGRHDLSEAFFAARRARESPTSFIV